MRRRWLRRMNGSITVGVVWPWAKIELFSASQCSQRGGSLHSSERAVFHRRRIRISSTFHGNMNSCRKVSRVRHGGAYRNSLQFPVRSSTTSSSIRNRSPSRSLVEIFFNCCLTSLQLQSVIGHDQCFPIETSDIFRSSSITICN